jgi:hypothetical protein
MGMSALVYSKEQHVEWMAWTPVAVFCLHCVDVGGHDGVELGS